MLDLGAAPSVPIEREDGSVDRVVAIGAFRRFPGGPAELLAEVHRVLREDGLLIATLDSEWWAESGWGRGFELVDLDPGPDQISRATLRRRPGSPTAAELEAPDPDEPAEHAAIRRALVRLTRAVDEIRESFHGELGRKSARIADLEQLVHEIDSGYRSTLSWRATAPLRRAGEAARSARRRS